MYRLKYIFFLLIMVILVSCTGEKKVNHCFYYWKTGFSISSEEQAVLEEQNVNRIYLRFFDVSWNGIKAVPNAGLLINSEIPAESEIIPTVFITNQTLLNLETEKNHELAENIYYGIQQILAENHITNVPEIQMDCDWTESTKEKYFTLLSSLREKISSHITLSATIRLHQVKYRERTGVPPVDRGVLMFYNIDSPGNLEIKNSIMDFEVGKQYLDRLSEYPLSLDIALPIYSWGVVFQGNNYMGLIKNMSREELEESPDIVCLEGNLYMALENTYISDTYIYKNERIRIEECEYPELIKTAQYISDRLSNKDLNVILYHLDKELIGRYSNEEIHSLYNAFN